MPDRKLVAFLDLEHEVDARILLADGLRRDPRLEIAVLAIEFVHALDVALHISAPQWSARLRLQFEFFQIVVFDLFVAFKGDAKSSDFQQP